MQTVMLKMGVLSPEKSVGKVLFKQTNLLVYTPIMCPNSSETPVALHETKTGCFRMQVDTDLNYENRITVLCCIY